MARERIEEVTVLRALAFMAITMQHCIAEYIYRADILPPDELMLAMLFHFTRFGTPAFVFLSGVILFYNYGAGQPLRYGTFLRKRAADILVPFLSWTVIYWAAVTLYSGHSLAEGAAWSALPMQLLRPTYGYHLWFILMIFQFYLLFPLLMKAGEPLRRFAVRQPGRAFGRTLLIMGAAAALYAALVWFSYYRAGQTAAEWGGLWAWLMEHRSKWFVFYAFYFMLGAVCAYGLARFRQTALSWLVPSGLLFIGLYIWIGYELLQFNVEEMRLGMSTYLRPAVFALITVQLLTAYGLSVLVIRYGGWFKRALLFIGKHSFGGFLAHAFVLMLVSGVTRPMALAGYHLPAAVLTFFVAAAGSIGLAKLLSLLPFGALLIGAQGRRRPAAGAGRPASPDKRPLSAGG